MFHGQGSDLARLAARLLLTAASRTMSRELLPQEYIAESPLQQAFCYDLVSAWLHGGEADDIRQIAESVENELRLPRVSTKFC